jgi:hypothetical protein
MYPERTQAPSVTAVMYTATGTKERGRTFSRKGSRTRDVSFHSASISGVTY